MDSYLDNLAQPDPNWQGMGAVYREDDPRDNHLEFLPQVIEALPNLPPSYMAVEPGTMPFIYDQDGEGACCPNSICGAKTVEEFADIGKWNHYDAHQMYTDLGGTGPNGIAADPALRYARDLGCRNMADDKRFKIGSYMFAPRNRNEWRNTLAAALVSTGPCVVALLVPTVFGWRSGDVKTSGYHQMALVGYEGLGDNDYAVFLNSWSAAWGNQGFCGIKWGYLEDGGDFQNKYVYGYKMVDVKDWVPPPPPPPPPNVPPVIGGVTQKSRKKFIVTGVGFDPEAILYMDGNLTGFPEDNGRFAYRGRLNIGPHAAIVTNPNGMASVPFPFDVKEIL